MHKKRGRKKHAYLLVLGRGAPSSQRSMKLCDVRLLRAFHSGALDLWVIFPNAINAALFVDHLGLRAMGNQM